MIAPARHAKAVLPVALLAALLVACGGRSAADPPTAAMTAAGSSVSTRIPTRTPTNVAPASSTVATPEVENLGTAPCSDPYPGGAPYAPTPGTPIRLHPAGAPTPLPGYTPLPFVGDAALERVVRQALGNDSAHFGVYIKNLADGHGVAVNASQQFYGASLYKTWVMLEAEHQLDEGLLQLNQRFIVSDYYAAFGLNDGELQACDEPSLEQALASMMSISDNVAGNLVLELVGAANINASLRSLGMTASGLYQDDSLPATAAEMELLLEAIARQQAVSPGASDAMLALLETETVDDRLPALLPDGTRIAHKTGSWTTAMHDAGVVYSPNATYVIVVLSDYDFTEGYQGKIAQLSKAVYDFFNRSP